MSFNFYPIRRAIFVACNCVFAQARCRDEIIHLKLQESYCLPVLTCAVAALKVSEKTRGFFTCCVEFCAQNYILYFKWESAENFICSLSRLDLHHIVKLRTIQFYERVGSSACQYVWAFSTDHCLHDDELRFSFRFSKHVWLTSFMSSSVVQLIFFFLILSACCRIGVLISYWLTRFRGLKLIVFINCPKTLLIVGIIYVSQIQ